MLESKHFSYPKISFYKQNSVEEIIIYFELLLEEKKIAKLFSLELMFLLKPGTILDFVLSFFCFKKRIRTNPC